MKVARFSECSLVVLPGPPLECGALVLVRLLCMKMTSPLFKFEGAALFDEGSLDAKRSLLLLYEDLLLLVEGPEDSWLLIS